ncbi:unnamed protein product, partial [Phaeothamnion confervicola]
AEGGDGILEACLLLRHLMWIQRAVMLPLLARDDMLRIATLCLQITGGPLSTVAATATASSGDRRWCGPLQRAALATLVDMVRSGDASFCVAALAAGGGRSGDEDV